MRRTHESAQADLEARCNVVATTEEQRGDGRAHEEIEPREERAVMVAWHMGLELETHCPLSRAQPLHRRPRA